MTNFLTIGDPGYDTERTGYNLSVEEEEAIRQAMAGPREAVKAR